MVKLNKVSRDKYGERKDKNWSDGSFVPFQVTHARLRVQSAEAGRQEPSVPFCKGHRTQSRSTD
jgi:hypothetical protein